MHGTSRAMVIFYRLLAFKTFLISEPTASQSFLKSDTLLPFKLSLNRLLSPPRLPKLLKPSAKGWRAMVIERSALRLVILNALILLALLFCLLSADNRFTTSLFMHLDCYVHDFLIKCRCQFVWNLTVLAFDITYIPRRALSVGEFHHL